MFHLGRLTGAPGTHCHLVRGLIALRIASFGVMNNMISSVLRRTREIGVIPALGARQKTIRRFFTIEVTAIGFFEGLVEVAFDSIPVQVAKQVITNMAKIEVANRSTVSGFPMAHAHRHRQNLCNWLPVRVLPSEESRQSRSGGGLAIRISASSARKQRKIPVKNVLVRS